MENTPLSVPASTDAVIPLPRAPRDDASDQPRILITLPETARILGVGRSTVSRLVRQGALECVSIGSLRRVPLQSVHDFVDHLRADAHGR
jgi:excisionase family DNA binding protein